MKALFLRLIVIVGLALAMTGISYAADGGDAPKGDAPKAKRVRSPAMGLSMMLSRLEVLTSFDKNKNGKLDADEIEEVKQKGADALRAYIAGLDKNGDKRTDADEHRANAVALIVKLFPEIAKANEIAEGANDEALAKVQPEVGKAAEAAVKKLFDADGDGKLSEEEQAALKAVNAALMPRREGKKAETKPDAAKPEDK